jgi:hypothetical protein
VRNLVVVVVLLVVILAANAFATPNVLRAAVGPEPGILVALGGGLVCLASLVRNRLPK